VHGVFSDSDRKSMQAMLARVTEPVSYQALLHFISNAEWDAQRVWPRPATVTAAHRPLRRRPRPDIPPSRQAEYTAATTPCILQPSGNTDGTLQGLPMASGTPLP
jgi:hypothetical protein